MYYCIRADSADSTDSAISVTLLSRAVVGSKIVAFFPAFMSSACRPYTTTSVRVAALEFRDVAAVCCVASISPSTHGGCVASPSLLQYLGTRSPCRQYPRQPHGRPVASLVV